MIFMIWSGSKKSWWSSDGMGYTKDKSQAGKFSIEDLEVLSLDGLGPRERTPANADVLVLVGKS